jgi:hypothetical protein
MLLLEGGMLVARRFYQMDASFQITLHNALGPEVAFREIDETIDAHDHGHGRGEGHRARGPLDDRGQFLVSSPDNIIPTFAKKVAPDVDDISRPSRPRSWKMSTGGRISHGQSFLMSVWLRPADFGGVNYGRVRPCTPHFSRFREASLEKKSFRVNPNPQRKKASHFPPASLALCTALASFHQFVRPTYAGRASWSRASEEELQIFLPLGTDPSCDNDGRTPGQSSQLINEALSPSQKTHTQNSPAHETIQLDLGQPARRRSMVNRSLKVKEAMVQTSVRGRPKEIESCIAAPSSLQLHSFSFRNCCCV